MQTHNFPSFAPLALALAGFPRTGGPNDFRLRLESVPAMGFRAVTLDGTAPAVRARDLDRSGRRDLAALMRRRELTCAGVDLWIPPEHFSDPANTDRALEALLAAIELAADLSRLSASAVVSTSAGSPAGAPVVSAFFPPSVPSGLLDLIEDRAETCGVRVAAHAWPVALPLSSSSPIGVGLDPASLLLAGADPAAAASRLLAGMSAVKPAETPSLPSPTSSAAPPAPARTPAPAALPTPGLALARLSDANLVARGPVGAPDGRLSLLAYAVALLTGGYPGRVIVDTRGVPTPEAAARQALDAWTGAAGS